MRQWRGSRKEASNPQNPGKKGWDEREEEALPKKERPPMAENDIPPCLIYIDKEGRWYHKGVEMIHRDFIRLFYQHMEMDSEGRYVIKFGGDRCYLEVEDTPFVIRRTEFKKTDQENSSRFILDLSDDRREDLIPDTLYVGNENVLYCRVKDRRFPARFNRTAYYQLAQYILEEDNQYFLPFNGEKYLILKKDR